GSYSRLTRMLEGSRRQGPAWQGAQEIPLRLQEAGKGRRRAGREVIPAIPPAKAGLTTGKARFFEKRALLFPGLKRPQAGVLHCCMRAGAIVLTRRIWDKTA